MSTYMKTIAEHTLETQTKAWLVLSAQQGWKPNLCITLETWQHAVLQAVFVKMPKISGVKERIPKGNWTAISHLRNTGENIWQPCEVQWKYLRNTLEKKNKKIAEDNLKSQNKEKLTITVLDYVMIASYCSRLQARIDLFTWSHMYWTKKKKPVHWKDCISKYYLFECKFQDKLYLPDMCTKAVNLIKIYTCLLRIHHIVTSHQ